MLAPDLIVANSVIGIASISLGCLAARSKFFLPRWRRLLVAAFAVGGLLTYSLWLEDNLILARLLPVADVIAWTNIQFPAAAILAGIAWIDLRAPRWQRIPLCAILLALGFWRMIEPYTGAMPHLTAAHWAHGICRQSTTSTCSPAAAATALAAVGISTSEAEMADLCLTRADGTFVLGLYRGLKLKTAGSKWNVAVFNGNADELRRMPLPAIIIIHAAGISNGRLSVGDRHAVVLFAFNPDGTVEVGDPYSGRQRLQIGQLAEVYDNCAIALERD
ncbi:MAG TPA: cysteine peptidase family C39 domain-containing protein [Tepidisphaeraceae bacterium]|nr:cysteine peptidase family C39 domain-containing protein [Tepidisphaeraceae bacterium]